MELRLAPTISGSAVIPISALLIMALIFSLHVAGSHSMLLVSKSRSES